MGCRNNSKSSPTRENRGRLCGLYLLGIPGMIKPHEHVVPFVRGTAQGVAHDDDAVADINRVQDRRQYANIGFGARDNQRVRLALAKMLDQLGSAKAE